MVNQKDNAEKLMLNMAKTGIWVYVNMQRVWITAPQGLVLKSVLGPLTFTEVSP